MQQQTLIDLSTAVSLSKDDYYKRQVYERLKPQLDIIYANLSPALADKVRSFLEESFYNGFEFGAKKEQLRLLERLLEP